MSRTNWDREITALLERHGYQRCSTDGIGLDFKNVYFMPAKYERATCTGLDSIGGNNYKDVYDTMCSRLARNGRL